MYFHPLNTNISVPSSKNKKILEKNDVFLFLLFENMHVQSSFLRLGFKNSILCIVFPYSTNRHLHLKKKLKISLADLGPSAGPPQFTRDGERDSSGQTAQRTRSIKKWTKASWTSHKTTSSQIILPRNSCEIVRPNFCIEPLSTERTCSQH